MNANVCVKESSYNSYMHELEIENQVLLETVANFGANLDPVLSTCPPSPSVTESQKSDTRLIADLQARIAEVKTVSNVLKELNSRLVI